LRSTRDFRKKPWTLWEISKESEGTNQRWRTYYETIYPIDESIKINNEILSYSNDNILSISNDFTENLYLSDNIKAIALIRIADIKVKLKKIKNDSKAVIVLFSNTDKFDIERLKLSLIILPQINNYLNKHYDLDSLSAFIEERNEKIEVKRLKHGFQRYLDNLKEQALLNANYSFDQHESFSDEILLKSDPEFVNIIYNLLIPWSTLKKMIMDFKNVLIEICNLKNKIINEPKNKIAKTELKNLSSNCLFELREVYEKIQRTFYILINNEIATTLKANKSSKVDCFVRYEISEKTKILLSWPLFDVILAEAIINAKKNRSPYEVYLLSCRFFVGENGSIMLELINNCGINDDKFIKRLNNQNKNNKKGLGLINYVTMELFSTKIIINYGKSIIFDGYEFNLRFPISKI